MWNGIRVIPFVRLKRFVFNHRGMCVRAGIHGGQWQLIFHLPGARLTGGGELPALGAGNQTWIFSKSRKAHMLLTAEPSLQALLLIFDTEYHCVVLAGLELTNSLVFVSMLLPLAPECGDSRRVPPHPTLLS